MTTNGPTIISSLSVATSLSGQARILVIATIGSSLQTVTVPLSVIQNNNIGPLDTLSDVSISGPTDGMGLVYSSSRAQWVNGSVGDMKAANNLSEVDPDAARTYLGAISSASVQGMLGAYLTSASAATALAPYLTSASVVTLLTSYLTSASASTQYSSIAHTHQLRGLSDVSVSTNTPDQYTLTWSSVRQQWVALPGAVGAISNIVSAADASVSAPSNGQLFVYRSSDSKWHNETFDYVTSASLATLIGPYATSASVVSYVTTQLAPYITSASAVTLVAPYVTSASLLTALGPYITSASVVTLIAPYVTSASLLTALTPYITSASITTVLGSYVTSASANTSQSTFNIVAYSLYGGL